MTKKPALPVIGNYQPVESSNITHVGFDPLTSSLGVKFRTTAEYIYPGVTPEEFEAFIKAKSAGQHFARHFRGRDFVRVGEPEDRQ